MNMLEIKNNQEEKLIGILDENKDTKNLIIICHGSRGSKNGRIQTYLAKKLKKEFNVFRFDFSGNGGSEGNLEDSTYSKDIDDLLSVVKYFLDKKYIISTIIGHSKSGTEILLASKKLLKKTKTLISLSPRIDLNDSQEMISLKENKEFFEKNDYYLYISSSGFQHKINKKYIEDLKKWNNVKKHNISKIPILIIHGEKDQVINLDGPKNFSKKFNNMKFEQISNANHSFEGKLSELSELILKYLL